LREQVGGRGLVKGKISKLFPWHRRDFNVKDLSLFPVFKGYGIYDNDQLRWVFHQKQVKDEVPYAGTGIQDQNRIRQGVGRIDLVDNFRAKSVIAKQRVSAPKN